MQQEIDQPRRPISAEQVAQQLVLFGPTPGRPVTGANSGLSGGAYWSLSHTINMRLEPRIHLQRGWMGGLARQPRTVDNRETRADIPIPGISTPPGSASGRLAFESGIGNMTGSTRSSSGLDDRRKRLLFRCWHRGTREMDLILGRFATPDIRFAR
jgi:hypothetical protein